MAKSMPPAQQVASYIAADADERELLAELLGNFIAELNSGELVHDNWSADRIDDVEQLAELYERVQNPPTYTVAKAITT